MNNPTVKEIVEKFLTTHGFDGLYSKCNRCSCEVDDLMPCSDYDNICDCQAAYRYPATEKDKTRWGEDCEYVFKLEKPERSV